MTLHCRVAQNQPGSVSSRVFVSLKFVGGKQQKKTCSHLIKWIGIQDLHNQSKSSCSQYSPFCKQQAGLEESQLRPPLSTPLLFHSFRTCFHYAKETGNISLHVHVSYYSFAHTVCIMIKGLGVTMTCHIWNDRSNYWRGCSQSAAVVIWAAAFSHRSQAHWYGVTVHTLITQSISQCLFFFFLPLCATLVVQQTHVTRHTR